MFNDIARQALLSLSILSAQSPSAKDQTSSPTTSTPSHRFMMKNYSAGVPPSFGAPPQGLQDRGLMELQSVPIVVQGGNIGDDGSIELAFDGVTHHVGRGVGGTVVRRMEPTEAVCATIELPSPDYSGVVAAFYTKQSSESMLDFVRSWNDNREDEIDIEFLGSPSKLQTNYRVRGDMDNGRVKIFNPTATTTDFCLFYDDNVTEWYLDGKLIQSSNVKDFKNPMYVWFTLWDTTGKWNCCGPIRSHDFRMNIPRFSMYAAAPADYGGDGQDDGGQDDDGQGDDSDSRRRRK